jgi:hypothetical protein
MSLSSRRTARRAAEARRERAAAPPLRQRVLRGDAGMLVPAASLSVFPSSSQVSVFW